MKKIFYFTLATFALLAVSSCEKNLDIPQKGVTAIETFYQTDEDCEAALVAAYASFAENVVSQNGSSIYTHYKACLNNCGDDMYAAGSNFGDNDFMAALNEFRYDSGNDPIGHLYQRLFMANYACNLVIDHFKDGLPEGGPTPTTKRAVAEARVLRAYMYFLLTALWNTPPVIDHVITDGLPYNSDKDPENPMSHDDLFKWVAAECEAAIPDLEERKSTADKDGAVKMTKGFAWAVQGKALLFAKDYAGAKTALKKVIDSGKYALVPGNRYWENFHVEGDCNEEKVFETNLEYNSGVAGFNWANGSLAMVGHSTWMEANIWNWRSDHFATPPQGVYTGGVDGWGGLGVPQWFGDEFFANDGHSPRFDATFKRIDDAVYNMEYAPFTLYYKHGVVVDADKKICEKDVDDPYLPYAKPKMVKKDGVEVQDEAEVLDQDHLFDAEPVKVKVKLYTLNLKDLPEDLRKVFRYIGINDVKDGLYGQSFWLPIKQLVRKTDCASYGNNIRMNNNVVMRYAEVLLLYAEACLQSGDAGQATWAVNQIRQRSDLSALGTVDMNVLKKEKSYELWLEGSRWLDLVRWGDTQRVKQAGQDVPKLFDKNFRAPQSGEKVTWQFGSEANSRFYTISSHEAIDAKWTVGFKEGKHEFFPFPTSVMDKNPNLVQNPGW